MPNPCWNGPNCKYLANGRCSFYHPQFHVSMSARNTYPQNYIDHTNYQSAYTSYSSIYQNQNQPRINLFNPFYDASNQRMHMNQPQYYQHSPYNPNYHQLMRQNNEQSREMDISSESQSQEIEQFTNLSWIIDDNNRNSQDNQQNNQNVSEQWGSMNFDDIKNRKFLPKKWFFQKNISQNSTNLSKQFLQRHAQCSICFDNFLNQQTGFENGIQTNQKQQFVQQKITTQQNIVTQLFCKHAFHKVCIQKWLRKSALCPLCKQDFRKHANYLQWDEQYNTKIRNQYNSEMSDNYSYDDQQEEDYFYDAQQEEIQLQQYFVGHYHF